MECGPEPGDRADPCDTSGPCTPLPATTRLRIRSPALNGVGRLHSILHPTVSVMFLAQRHRLGKRRTADHFHNGDVTDTDPRPVRLENALRRIRIDVVPAASVSSNLPLMPSAPVLTVTKGTCPDPGAGAACRSDTEYLMHAEPIACIAHRCRLDRTGRGSSGALQPQKARSCIVKAACFLCSPCC